MAFREHSANILQGGQFIGEMTGGPLYANNVTLNSLVYPVTDGAAGTAIVTNGSGTLSFGAPTPMAGGSNTEVQYNNNGVLDGDPSFTFNGSTVEVPELNINAEFTFPTTDGTAGQAITTNGAGTLMFSSVGGGVSFPLVANPTGSAAAPAYSFGADTNTGMSAAVADTLVLSTAGVERLSLSPSGVPTINGAYTLPNADGTSGQILTTNGAGAVTFSTPVVSFPLAANPTGSAAAPAYSFSGDTNTGMSAAVADTLVLSTAGSPRLSLSPTGVPTINGAYTLPNADGSSNQVLQTNGSGTVSFVTLPTVAPGAPTNSIQFNNSGSFGGDANLTFNSTTETLTQTNHNSVNGSRTTTGGGVSKVFDLVATSAAEIGVHIHSVTEDTGGTIRSRFGCIHVSVNGAGAVTLTAQGDLFTSDTFTDQANPTAGTDGTYRMNINTALNTTAVTTVQYIIASGTPADITVNYT